MKGLPLLDLYEDLVVSMPTLTVTALESMMQCLLDNHIVIQAGIDQICYVSHSNSRTWLIHSLKDTKG